LRLDYITRNVKYYIQREEIKIMMMSYILSGMLPGALMYLVQGYIRQLTNWNA